MAFFRRDKPAGQPSLKELVRRASDSRDPLEAGVLYTQAARLAIELKKKRRGPALIADAVRTLAAAQGDGRTIAQAHLALADTARKIGMVAEAMHEYGCAFRLDASLVVAVRSARAIAEAGEAWAQAAELIEQEIAVLASDGDCAVLRCEQGVLVRDRLADLDRAVALLHDAIKRDPASVLAHRELAATLVARAESLDDEDRAARDRYDAAGALSDVADIVPDDERIALLEEALDVAPEHLGALEKLEEMVPDDHARLMPRWTRHVEAFADSPVADDLRLRLGHAHLEAGQSETALPHLERLARGDDLECALLVIDIHARAGRVEQARAWGLAARERAPQEQRLPVLRHVFQALTELDPDTAYAVARDIVVEDPSDAVALDYCETYCERQEDWAALEGILTDVAAQFDPGSKRRLSLFRKLAKSKESQQNDLAGALDVWRTIESETEADQGARAARAARESRMGLAERVGNWDEVAQLLEDEHARASEDDERVLLMMRLVAVHRDERKDPASAARALLRVLDMKAPDDQAGALTALARVLASVGAASPVIEETTAQANAAAPETRAAMHRILASLHDEWDAPEKAFSSWTVVREADGRDAEALARLVELAIATGQKELAIELIAEQAKGTGGKRAVMLHRRIAALAAERADHDRAADALTAALDAAPGDHEIAEDLAHALARAGRHGEQLVVLRLLVTSAPDDATRLKTKQRIAHLLSDQLRDEDEALAMWEQIAIGTREPAALLDLVAAARQEGDLRRLDVMLRRLALIAPSAKQRAETVLERAELLATELERKRDAIGALLESIEGDARAHLPTLAFLESLAEEQRDDIVLSRALEHQVGIVPAPLGRLLLARLADLYEGPLADPAQAMHALERWEVVGPDVAEPRLRAIPYLVSGQRWDAVLTRLDALVSLDPERRAHFVDFVITAVDGSKPTDDQPLAELFVELSHRAASSDARRDLLIRGAALFELTGGTEGAFDAAAAALAITGPEDRLLTILDRLVSAAGKQRELDAIYDLYTARSAPPQLRKTIVLRHIALLRVQRRFSDALDRLLAVSAMAPDDETLLDALEALAPQASRLSDLLVAYEDRTGIVPSGAPAVELMLRAVRVCFANERGFDTLRFFVRAVELGKGDFALLDHIEATTQELGRMALEQLMTVYEAARRTEPDPLRRAELLVRAARLTLTVAPNAKPAAFRLIEEALALAPTEERLLDAVEAMTAERGMVEQLDAHLETAIDKTMSTDVAAAFLGRHAGILHRRLGKPSEAADAYLRLWALRPTDPDVFRHLRVCLLETGRIHELISAAERELSRLDPGPHQLGLMREVARLWEEDAGNRWEALDAWKRVLEHAPTDILAAEALGRLGRASTRAKEE